jgi:hypothetical protein
MLGVKKMYAARDEKREHNISSDEKRCERSTHYYSRRSVTVGSRRASIEHTAQLSLASIPSFKPNGDKK